MSSLPPIERFDKIEYNDLSEESTWEKIGKGSFGCVYQGEYLGLPVAIKEVLPSGEYDVDKYFARECKLLAECRHPNIVQYLGLCLAPGTSRRILIISEYLTNGNLRGFIYHDDIPFPWRLRISFGIDVARAMTYLHARNCLHRDLKGENLLLTELNRVKVCDFGFARIAARNEEEMRRMSYCGTDGYMAPEILLGLEFSLPADIFSLGVIFCEIISRTLVGGEVFKREIPSFGISSSEIRSHASLHCPQSFISLAIACVAVNPEDRPLVRDVLSTLRAIEVEILEMESRGVGLSSMSDRGGSFNVGTLSFSGTTKRGKKRPQPPRLPSFGKSNVGSSIRYQSDRSYESSQESEDDVANIAMAKVRVGRHGIRGESEDDLLPDGVVPEIGSEYSTEVIRRGGERPRERTSMIDSVITVKGLKNHDRLNSNSSLPTLPSSWILPDTASNDPSNSKSPSYSTTFNNDPLITVSHVDSNFSFMTARTSTLSITGATLNHGSPTASEDSVDTFYSTLRGLPSEVEVDHFPPPTSNPSKLSIALHRFSIYRPAFQMFLGSLAPYSFNTPAAVEFNARTVNNSKKNSGNNSKRSAVDERNSSGGLFGGVGTSKCGICEKRLGMIKAFLECDDCGFRCHIKCSDACSLTCQGDEELVNVVPLQPNRPPPPIPSSSSTRVSKLIKKRPV